MSEFADRRRLTRLPFAVEVEVHTQDRTIRAQTRDINMQGVFVAQEEPHLPLGTQCQVEVVLSSGEGKMGIRARGEVVWQGRDPESGQAGVGIKFTEMDAHSQEVLWLVVRYNSPLTEGPRQ
jgi:c-di-GMP-binding flagellar brake protein YcgR